MFRKNKISRILTPAIALAILAPAGFAPAVLAHESADSIEQVIVTGSRGKPLTVSDSPVPVDVFTAETRMAHSSCVLQSYVVYRLTKHWCWLTQSDVIVAHL